MRAAAFLLPILLLAACASGPGPYKPAMKPGQPGYYTTRLEEARYRVAYRGAGDVAALTDYALFQAAEIAIANSADWFIVDSRYVEGGGARRAPSVTVGVGAGSWGGHTGVNVGTSVGVPVGGGGGDASAVTLEIRLARGVRPAAGDVYNARDVHRSIAPRIRRN